MIAKFSDHGTGKASGVLNYLLKEKGVKGALVPRAHAKVLYGDPVLTEHLIDTTPYKSKYKSGYLSFRERADEISEAVLALQKELQSHFDLTQLNKANSREEFF